MVHLRVVAPPDLAEGTMAILDESEYVMNLVHLPGAARKPDGDVFLCDVAREEASVVIGDLKHLGVPKTGSIAVEILESQLSTRANELERAAKGLPSDAVVWEEVESRTHESTELSGSFLAFMVLAMLLSACGIALDSPILIVGAMVVGPEFGPLAALCVALVEKRPHLARRSFVALAVGFPVGMAATFVFTALLASAGLITWDSGPDAHPFTSFISHPDAWSAIIAVLAGVAGMLSLTTAKSGALLGVLISVTTIIAAAYAAFAAALGNWPEAAGAALQLVINLVAIVSAGLITLYIQRRRYIARRNRHLASRQPPAG